MKKVVEWNAPQKVLVREIDSFNTPRKLSVSRELANKLDNEASTKPLRNPKKGIVEAISGWLKESF
jgi:hypothetical protein